MDELTIENEIETEGSVHRHPLEPISLAFGVIFAILGLVFVFGDIDAKNVSSAWVWAALFGAIGLLLLAVGVRRHLSSEGHRPGAVAPTTDR